MKVNLLVCNGKKKYKLLVMWQWMYIKIAFSMLSVLFVNIICRGMRWIPHNSVFRGRERDRNIFATIEPSILNLGCGGFLHSEHKILQLKVGFSRPLSLMVVFQVWTGRQSCHLPIQFCTGRNSQNASTSKQNITQDPCEKFKSIANLGPSWLYRTVLASISQHSSWVVIYQIFFFLKSQGEDFSILGFFG